MKQNHTDITIVLDRSGSMSTVADDTIGGFNRFLKDQKEVKGTAQITLHQFDTEFETVINGDDIQKAPDLTSSTFVPRGSTALLDAIGRAIGETGARLDAKSDSEKAEKVVFVIITDGQENASREFQSKKIMEMIEHQKNTYSWQFVFLGANQDAIKVAVNLGMNANSSMTYAHNSAGTQAAFASTSAQMKSFRSGASKSVEYSTSDRNEQKKAGVTP